MVKSLSLGPVDETLENDRTIPDSGERTRSNRKIVADKIEFRDSRLRKIYLVGMRYLDVPFLDGEHRAGGFLCHEIRLPLRPLARDSSASRFLLNERRFRLTGHQLKPPFVDEPLPRP